MHAIQFRIPSKYPSDLPGYESGGGGVYTHTLHSDTRPTSLFGALMLLHYAWDTFVEEAAKVGFALPNFGQKPNEFQPRLLINRPDQPRLPYVKASCDGEELIPAGHTYSTWEAQWPWLNTVQ